MNKVEGVIFDWAGTTIDFGCFAPVNVFVQVFQDIGIEVNIDEARAPMGMLKKDHIRAMLKMTRIEELWKEKYGRGSQETDVEDLYSRFEPLLLSSLLEYTEPLPGVTETIQNLRNRGIKIGSTTGYTDSMMRIVTQGAKEKGYAPDFWITPDSTHSFGRPFPYMIFRNIEELKLSSTYTVIKVGDTKADIKEAINAGVWSVGVCVGSSQMGVSFEEFNRSSSLEKEALIKKTEQEFIEFGADFTIGTIRDLPNLIELIDILIKEGKKPNGK